MSKREDAEGNGAETGPPLKRRSRWCCAMSGEVEMEEINDDIVINSPENGQSKNLKVGANPTSFNDKINENDVTKAHLMKATEAKPSESEKKTDLESENDSVDVMRIRGVKPILDSQKSSIDRLFSLEFRDKSKSDLSEEVNEIMKVILS